MWARRKFPTELIRPTRGSSNSCEESPMVKRPPPNTFDRLAREVLLDSPDGPIVLGVMAKMEQALRPATEAINRLVEAIAADLRDPSDGTRSEMARAKVAYETLTKQSCTEDLWKGYMEDAREFNESNRRQPPEMTEILDGLAERPSDMEYDIIGGLGGVQGTWHRLWGSISSARLFAASGVDQSGAVAAMRAEFEKKFGRALTAGEWERLTAHAHRHCDEVLVPTMAEAMTKAKRGPGDK